MTRRESTRSLALFVGRKAPVARFEPLAPIPRERLHLEIDDAEAENFFERHEARRKVKLVQRDGVLPERERRRSLQVVAARLRA